MFHTHEIYLFTIFIVAVVVVCGWLRTHTTAIVIIIGRGRLSAVFLTIGEQIVIAGQTVKFLVIEIFTF